MDVKQIIAQAIGVPIERVTDELEYGAIPEWDSLNHVNLMTALEERFCTSIDEDLMVELTSVRAIARFASERDGRR